MKRKKKKKKNQGTQIYYIAIFTLNIFLQFSSFGTVI